MATLVHITDVKNVPSIERAGIRPAKGSSAVFCMPVVQSHLISHQWLRELRRGGARVLVGVYFELPTHELVWAGRYNEVHQQVPLGVAIAQLNGRPDPLGFEIFIERKIRPSEIRKVRHLPQTIGWRYHPRAHGTQPCPCPMCLPRGAIKSRRIRVRDDSRDQIPALAEVIEALSSPSPEADPTDWLWPLRTKRRVLDPEFLERYMSSTDTYLLQEIALTLPYLRSPRSRLMLERLTRHDEPDVRAAASNGLDAVSRGIRPKRR